MAYCDSATPPETYVVPIQKGVLVAPFELVPAHGFEPQPLGRQYERIRLMAYCDSATPRETYVVPIQKGVLVAPFELVPAHGFEPRT